MRVIPGGLGILLFSAMMIPGVAAYADIPEVDAPDSLVFRDPFVDRNGNVTVTSIDQPNDIVFRDVFVNEAGAVVIEDVARPSSIVFRDQFINRSGAVTNPTVDRPDHIVFRDLFINRYGEVIEEYVDPPEGIIFRHPFVNSDGEVSDEYYVQVPQSPSNRLITLRGIYPNPFNPSTQVSFTLSEAAEVEISVLDLSGRRVCTLFQGPLDADLHVLRWNGQTDTGELAASGQYLFRIQAREEIESAKGLLIK